eukprot:CAMPEP_0177597320 /NCGR_PEP_ID=MMETSP0419_2-20121207/11639_1 /TAXON_ID=582737 /ORGANISM="Tetraselmis sp., Strain GSL018" /LENGTH=256 /DNA_ID=CAMNT_0019089463 /DNA_START=832 /DNA_END=1602 /DNA_ORIENTATION=+
MCSGICRFLCRCHANGRQRKAEGQGAASYANLVDAEEEEGRRGGNGNESPRRHVPEGEGEERQVDDEEAVRSALCAKGDGRLEDPLAVREGALEPGDRLEHGGALRRAAGGLVDELSQDAEDEPRAVVNIVVEEEGGLPVGEERLQAGAEVVGRLEVVLEAPCVGGGPPADRGDPPGAAGAGVAAAQAAEVAAGGDDGHPVAAGGLPPGVARLCAEDEEEGQREAGELKRPVDHLQVSQVKRQGFLLACHNVDVDS